LLIGAFGGYETFGYSSNTLNGDGWTGGRFWRSIWCASIKLTACLLVENVAALVALGAVE
jgi:hypothetical protein